MADEAPDADNGGTEDKAPENTFTAITSQEEFDKAIQYRIARERAKFDGFDQYKTDAEELAKIRDGEKTELQKLTEQLQAQTARAETAERESLKSSVAAEKGVPAGSLTGTTREELEAAADQLIAWRDQNKPEPKKALQKGSLKSGTTGTDTSGSDPKQPAADALRLLRNG